MLDWDNIPTKFQLSKSSRFGHNSKGRSEKDNNELFTKRFPNGPAYTGL